MQVFTAAASRLCLRPVAPPLTAGTGKREFILAPAFAGQQVLNDPACAHRVAALYSATMFARKLAVDIIVEGDRRPCPLEWLDSFCMRNFTGSAEFDDTLPLADGKIEAGFRVNPERLAQALSDWLTRRGKGGGQPVRVEIRVEIPAEITPKVCTAVESTNVNASDAGPNVTLDVNLDVNDVNTGPHDAMQTRVLPVTPGSTSGSKIGNSSNCTVPPKTLMPPKTSDR